MELEALQKALPAFAALGASLVAISPQLEKFNRQVRKQHQLEFEVLSDPENQIARQFGLVYQVQGELRQVYEGFGLDLNKYNGDDSWTLPMPARFIIDQKSIIRYAEVNPDYTERPEPEETVAALKAVLNE
ncbi:MAG: peroxiredoxin-like family protein [bacterium]